MYKLAYLTLKKNIALFGVLIVLLVVVEQFIEINTGVSFTNAVILALFTHRMILLDENSGAGGFFNKQGPGGEKLPVIPFFIVSGIGFFVFLLGAVDVQDSQTG